MSEDKKGIKIQFVFLDPTSSLLPGHTQVPTRIFLESLTAVSNTKSTPGLSLKTLGFVLNTKTLVGNGTIVGNVQK